MSELFFDIFMSGFLGCVIILCAGFGLGCILNADDWTDRFFGALAILFSIFIGFLIALLWTTGVRGLE